MSEGSVPPPYTDISFCSCTPHGKPIYTNEAWNQLFGTDESFIHLFPPEDQRCISAYISDAASGEAVTGEVFLLNLPGHPEATPMLFNFFPVHTAEYHVGAVLITAETLVEPTTWNAAQTHRRRLELLGRMTLGMAHDFNNLLSSIIGHTELIRMTLQEQETEPSLREAIETIEKAALDGAELIRKIQQYIRKEKQETYRILDPIELIQDSLAFTRPYWYNEPRRRGIEIKVVTDLQPVPPIKGSPSELREVLINLILNAIQAMPEGGTLTLRTSSTANTSVSIEICDTGTGIPPEIMERIFEPLFTTKGEHGTGMGLAVSKGIVQSHNGDIRVNSTPGAGTCFTLILPPASSDVSSPLPTATYTSSPSSSPATPTLRILVVDDEPMIRRVLARMLRLKQHEVYEAASGQEAIQIVQAKPVDLVITDLGMPEMHGRELAHRLKEISPTLPVFLLTGHTDQHDHGPHIDRILSKPFQLEEIEQAIQQFFQETL